MLAAHAALREGPVALDFDLVLERAFRVHCVRRVGTIWDSRLSPPNAGQSSARVIHVLLEGSVEWHGVDAGVLTAPSAYVAPLAHVEGSSGRRLRTLRTSGSPFSTVEIVVAPESLTRPVEERAVFELTPALAIAAARHAERVHRGDATDDARRESLAALFHALVDAKITSRDLGATLTEDEGVHGTLWRALVPFVERLVLSPSLSKLSSATGFSVGQLDRRIGAFLQGLDVPWPGWRDVTRGLRLRVAVLMLSNPDVPLHTLSKRCGYSSPEALSHALTTEGLPPPLELRRRILANVG